MHLHGNYENNIAEAYNLINKGKIDSAINLFEKLTSNYPSTAKGFHLKAYAYVQQNNLKKALESIQKANKLLPGSLDISLDYSNILNSLGKKKEAFELLKNFDISENKDVRVFYNLGCICMDEEKYADAVEYFKKTLTLDPKNKEASFNIGVSLFNNTEYKLAIEVFSAYQKEFGLNFEAERYISLSHFSLNNLIEADKSLQTLCTLKPDDGSIWYDRGIILSSLRRHYDAIHCYQKALEIYPDNNDAFWNMALLYQKEGKLAELIDVYENAQTSDAYSHIFNSFLAQAYHLAGKGEDAVKMINKAIDKHPLKNTKDRHYLNYFLIKGNILNSLNKSEEAIQTYKKVLEFDKNIEQALVNIGSVYINSNNSEKAIPYLLKATNLNPRYAPSYVNLGNAYYSIGDKKRALKAFAKAEKLDPSVSAALSSKAAAQMDSGKKENATFSLIEAIQKDPYNGNAYINLGVLLREQTQYKEAAKWLERGIVILKSQPYKHKQLASAYTNLGYCNLDLEEFDKMRDCFLKALECNEDHISVAGFLCYSKLYVSDWTDLKKYKEITAKKVKEGKNVCTPFCSFSVTDDPETQYKIATTYSQDRSKKTLLNTSYSYEKNVLHKKPRIAYISNDFHDHATMHLMAGLFENQDNKKFDYFALSYGNKKDGSDITKRVVSAFSKTYDVQKYTNEQIAELINRLEIDIAIDLKGYTYGTRMMALAHKPAPIQISYLGHPGTTGTNYIDYLLLDEFIVTDHNAKFFSEKIIKLKGCYQCTDDKRNLPLKKDRRDFGLPEDKFIFCSFNNSYKIQPEIYNIWMDLLKLKEDSILWLLDTHEYCKNNLLNEAKSRGIDKSRIIFSPRLLNSEHIQRQMCADLFLDTFPICAHTTASDALWVGLPLLTMSGKSMVSRVAGSALKNIGVEELITYSVKDYKEKALYLANNPNELKKIRDKIIHNRFEFPLFKTKEFSKNLEIIFLQLFDDFKKNFNKK